VAELRKRLKARNLPEAGKKSELVTRLEKHDQNNTVKEMPIGKPTGKSIGKKGTVNFNIMEDIEYDEIDEDAGKSKGSVRDRVNVRVRLESAASNPNPNSNHFY
jgi:hypothetical protein